MEWGRLEPAEPPVSYASFPPPSREVWSLKLVTWNVNGGYGLDPDDPTKLLGYENLDYFIDLLGEIDADVVCLQEVHANAERSQADEVARSLGLQGVFESLASESHIDANYRLGNAVLAKQPFQAARSVTLPRPHFSVKLPLLSSGKPAALHDKLVQIVRLDGLTVANTHLLPLHVLGASWASRQGRELAEVTAKLLIDELRSPLVLCGDFNHPDVRDSMPSLMRTFNLVDVLPGETSLPHSNARVDHILVSSELADNFSSRIIPAFADHFPCVTVLGVYSLPEPGED